MLDPETLNAIGRQLRLMYDGLGRPAASDRTAEPGRARLFGPEHPGPRPGRPGRDPQSLDSVRLPR